jgi:aerobic-type carbon monoxide dehydrogenase small subunit (CoxS/CutS family)
MIADRRADVTLTVNRTIRQLRKIPRDLTLLDVLHEELALTGTKFGCGMGICHACTVAVRPNAQAACVAVRACSVAAAALNECQITTVEGLAAPGELSALQQAFLDAFAFQCGYCTPGFLMAAFVLVDRLRREPVDKANVDAEIARACGDHTCRCTGYRRYHEAIRNVIMIEPGLTT